MDPTLSAYNAEKAIAEWRMCQGYRVNFDHLWQDVKELVWPEGSDFTIDRSPGQRVKARQHDMTGALALEKSAAVCESLLTPRQQRFHSLRASHQDLQKDRRVAEYFEQVTNLLFQMRGRPESGFYDQMHESWRSTMAFGNRCMLTMPSASPRFGVSYRAVHIGNTWIEVDSYGRIDTIFYKWRMTATAAMDKWGVRCPKTAYDRLKQGKPFEMHEYLHVVKPVRDYVPDAIGPKRFPFRSWEISLADKEFIPWSPDRDTEGIEEYGGYRTLPYTFSRFSTNTQEIYGRGPAMIILPDNAMLQDMERSTSIAGQIAALPPLLAQDDDLLGDGVSKLDVRPSAVNPGWLDMQGNPKVKPLDNGFKYPLTVEMSDRKREIINDAHFITLFQILVDNPNQTATEALLRAQEKGMLISPMVGRQQSEGLGPMIQREIDVLEEQGMMPEMPEPLLEAEGEYEVEYTSMATRLQREEEVQAIMATAADGQVVGQFAPTSIEKLDWDKAMEFIAESRGVPDHLIRDDRDFQERIAVQAAARAQDDAMASVPGMAKAAKDVSDAGMDPRALAEEMGGGGLAA